MAIPIQQKIWQRNEDDELELNLPKTINTDIGFQLMFGWPTDYDTDKMYKQKHDESYGAKTYNIGNYEYHYFDY